MAEAAAHFGTRSILKHWKDEMLDNLSSHLWSDLVQIEICFCLTVGANVFPAGLRRWFSWLDLIDRLNLGLWDLIYARFHWNLLGHGGSLFFCLIQLFTIWKRVLSCVIYLLRWWIGCISGHRPYTSRYLGCHVKFWHREVRVTYVRQLLLLLLLLILWSLAFLSSHFDKVCALFSWGHRWWVDTHLSLKWAIQNLTTVLEIELSVWIDELTRFLCLTIRPRHVYTAIVICENMVP